MSFLDVTSHGPALPGVSVSDWPDFHLRLPLFELS